MSWNSVFQGLSFYNFFKIESLFQVTNYDYLYPHVITCDNNSKIATLAFYLVLKSRKTTHKLSYCYQSMGGRDVKLSFEI